MFHVSQQFLKINKQLCAVDCFLLFLLDERRFLLRGAETLWYTTLLLRAGALWYASLLLSARALRGAESLRVPLYAKNRKVAMA